MDFFNPPENRRLILKREGNQCFYCLRAVDSSNHVIEHVVSRPAGNHSFRNVVAACRNCNNRKGNQAVETFLRSLYRAQFLDEQEFQDRMIALKKLQDGELKPHIN